MIDYFHLDRIVATVKVDGNTARVMGEALASHHRHESDKIRRLEASGEPSADLQVLILRWQLKRLEALQMQLERLIGHKLQEAARNGDGPSLI